MGQRRVAVVDRLVLADEAAQLRRERARPRFERRIRQHLVGLHGERRRHGQARPSSEDRDGERAHRAHSAGSGGAARPRRPGAPTRSRRSVSESAPPSAMTTAPSQISSTSGFQ